MFLEMLTEDLRNHVQDFGNTICDGNVEFFLDNNFAYYNNNGENDMEISFALMFSPLTLQAYSYYCEDLSKKLFGIDVTKGLSYFTICFLHEIGHYETWCDDEYKKEKKKVEEIEKTLDKLCYHKDEKEFLNYYREYHSLPMEARATVWALRYIFNNNGVVRHANDLFVKELDNIFQIIED